MSEFVVSARKYRPKKLEDVIGQSIITSTLQNAINNNQVAQSFYSADQEALEKLHVQEFFAKEINNYSENEIKDFSFNIFELDAASNNSVEDIRNLTESKNYHNLENTRFISLMKHICYQLRHLMHF